MKVLYDDQRHIICVPYTIDNLHRAAAILGLKRCWFHARPYPHYDMPKKWVADLGLALDEALLNLDINNIGYEQVSPREIVRVIRDSR